MSSSQSGAVSGSPLDRPLLQRSFTKSDTYIAQKFNKTKSMIERERNGTVMNSIFTLVSTIIGGGSLSLPYAFACTGLINGQICLLLISLITAYAIQLLVVTSRYTGATSYQDVGVKTFGPAMGGFVVFQIFLVCMCGSIGYCVLMGDLIPSVAPGIFNGTEFILGQTLHPGSPDGYNRLCYMVLAMLLIFPVTLLRQMSALKFTSIISVCAMLVLAGIIVYRNFQPLTENGAPIPIGNITYFREVDTQFMLAFPILACSFLCHFNVLPVYSDIIRPSKKRMNMVIFGTCIGVMVLYQVIATFGYFTFHQLLIEVAAGGDILNMYPSGDIAVTAGSIGLIVTVVLSYPLLVHPTRSSLLYIYFAFIRPPSDEDEDDGVVVVSSRKNSIVGDDKSGAGYNGDNNGRQDSFNGKDVLDDSYNVLVSPVSPLPDDESEDDLKLDRDQRITKAMESLSCTANFLITFGHMAIVLAVGYVCPNVVTVWTLMGATAGVIVSFVLPPLFYLRTTQSEHDTKCFCGTKCTSTRAPAYALLALGIIAFIGCTTITIYCDINPLVPPPLPNSTPAGNGTNVTLWAPGLIHTARGLYGWD
eukprot:INCI5040.10.p1 GENE.INCI5040.10~~INCI5040.10.p1  ORF type:complete len:589 (-),score=76.14 INCI5040.10:177-1943(-)